MLCLELLFDLSPRLKKYDVKSGRPTETQNQNVNGLQKSVVSRLNMLFARTGYSLM